MGLAKSAFFLGAFTKNLDGIPWRKLALTLMVAVMMIPTNTGIHIHVTQLSGAQDSVTEKSDKSKSGSIVPRKRTSGGLAGQFGGMHGSHGSQTSKGKTADGVGTADLADPVGKFAPGNDGNFNSSHSATHQHQVLYAVSLVGGPQVLKYTLKRQRVRDDIHLPLFPVDIFHPPKARQFS